MESEGDDVQLAGKGIGEIEMARLVLKSRSPEINWMFRRVRTQKMVLDVFSVQTCMYIP